MVVVCQLTAQASQKCLWQIARIVVTEGAERHGYRELEESMPVGRCLVGLPRLPQNRQ
jgi:hypothetical protein